MKRIYLLSLAAVVAVALFVGLTDAVLHLAHVGKPSATTIHGLTLRRLWATAVVVMAFASVIVGGLGLARPTGRFTTVNWKRGTVLTGLIAAINGGLVLVFANGGPGSGNGVVGGAAAVVLGLAAVALGSLGLARSPTSAGAVDSKSNSPSVTSI